MAGRVRAAGGGTAAVRPPDGEALAAPWEVGRSTLVAELGRSGLLFLASVAATGAVAVTATALAHLVATWRGTR